MNWIESFCFSILIVSTITIMLGIIASIVFAIFYYLGVTALLSTYVIIILIYTVITKRMK